MLQIISTKLKFRKIINTCKTLLNSMNNMILIVHANNK